jgi:hypothetical protein
VAIRSDKNETNITNNGVGTVNPEKDYPNITVTDSECMPSSILELGKG